jgi:hypothetical protein
MRDRGPVIYFTGPRKVEVALLREAFLRSGLTAGDVARVLGWRAAGSQRGRADSQRVKRYLGITPYPGTRGYPPRLRERFSYEMAVKLAEAIGVDPVDVGL